jgi:hypothetical protein
MIGPNNSQCSPLQRIICNCSSGAKSVGLVSIEVSGSGLARNKSKDCQMKCLRNDHDALASNEGCGP